MKFLSNSNESLLLHQEAITRSLEEPKAFTSAWNQILARRTLANFTVRSSFLPGSKRFKCKPRCRESDIGATNQAIRIAITNSERKSRERNVERNPERNSTVVNVLNYWFSFKWRLFVNYSLRPINKLGKHTTPEKLKKEREPLHLR